MSHLVATGHAYERPAGMPHDYAGPGSCCPFGKWAPQHQHFGASAADVQQLDLADQVADLTARIVKARDRANTYRYAIGRADIITASTARAHLDSVLDALADPHAYVAPQLRQVA